MRAIKTIINTYFNHDLDICVQVFNLLVIAGITAGLVIAGLSALTNAGAPNIMINLAVSILGFILLLVAEKRKCYRLCRLIIVIAVFIVAFPLLFFTAGGYSSGMPCFFVVAIVFTTAMMEGSERWIALAFESVLYIACCLFAYSYPETVRAFASEIDYVGDVIVGIVVSGVLLAAVTFLHMRLCSTKHLQVTQLNNELVEQFKARERYDRMKSEFLRVVAHEISTPMATIMASGRDTLDLLKENPLNLDEIANNQRRIEKKVMLIDGVITDLMDAVAIENGRLSLNRQPVVLSELLKIACDAHFKNNDKNNNSVVYDFQYDLPQVSADPIRIEQIIMNLLSNAVRHTFNGIITIKLVGTEKAQVVSVSDTGEGMDEEVLRSSFEQQISTREDYWRHGIGLHICRLIVSAHGGEIWIDSEKGRGTSVSFSLKEGTVG